jgi:hypothetical protein
VNKIILLWLNDKDEAADTVLRHQLEAQVRLLMPITAYAADTALPWMELGEVINEVGT